MTKERIFRETKGGHDVLKECELDSQSSIVYSDTPGTKGTIVAVHGLTGNHKTFYHYQNKFAGDYRFISVDLRGRGRSSQVSAETSLYQHAADIQTLIKKLGIENPILMGYSMGAYICAVLASQMDVLGLVLLDGAGTTEEKQRELIVPSLSRLKKIYSSEDDYVSQTKTIYESLNVVWDEAVEEITRYEVMQVPDGWKHRSEAEAMEKDFSSFYSFHPAEVFGNISCPTLLVIAEGPLGQKPSLFTQETYVETIRHANDLRKIVVPANHYTLMFEKQPEVENAIQDLLSDIEKNQLTTGV